MMAMPTATSTIEAIGMRPAPTHQAGTRQLIDRVQLLQRLDEARLRRVCSIHSPVGYGKSALLADWAARLRQAGVAVAWLDVDRDCADPQYFLAALEAAIDTAGSAAGELAAHSASRVGVRPAVKRLATMLRNHARPIVLILDDYDLAANDELDEVLGNLLRDLPQTVHVTIASRSRLHVRFGELWLDAHVTEIGPKEMRFSDQEIADLFGFALDAQNLAMVSVWTEGWPAAVQLALTVFRMNAGSARDLSQRLAEADGNVERYLTEQVLCGLPEMQRELLIQTSFLEEFNADLITAVTGCGPCGQLLHDLERSNVLLASVDFTPQWYRCHHLLREMMYSILLRRGVAELARLRLAAARCFEKRGDLKQAIHHGHCAEDYHYVAQLILDAGGIFYGVRHGGPAIRWLIDRVPAEILSRYPRLLVAQVFALTKEGRFQAAGDLVLAVRQRIEHLMSQRGEDIDPLLVRDLSFAELSLALYSGVRLTARDLKIMEDAVRDAAPEDFWLRGVLNNLLTWTQIRSGAFEQARTAAEAAIYYYDQAKSSNGLGHMHLYLGQLDLEAGKTDAALVYYRKARAFFAGGLFGDDAGCALADILIAEALYEQGDLEGARRIGEPALRLAENREGTYDILCVGYRTVAALIARADGIESGIREINTGIAYAQRNFFTLDRILQLYQAELEMDADAFSALPLDTTMAPAVEPQWMPAGATNRVVLWRERDLEILFNARHALLAGDPADAIAQLEPAAVECRRGERTRSLISVLVLLAVAHDKASDRPRALQCLREALRRALPGRVLRPFIEKGRTVIPLLAQLLTGPGLAVADQAQVQFVEQVMRIGNATSTTQTTLFSQRELEIIRLLAGGNNNKLIARALGIAPDTVRFHLKHIYEKFGVSDRHAVVSIASAQGLLS